MEKSTGPCTFLCRRPACNTRTHLHTRRGGTLVNAYVHDTYLFAYPFLSFSLFLSLALFHSVSLPHSVDLSLSLTLSLSCSLCLSRLLPPLRCLSRNRSLPFSSSLFLFRVLSRMIVSGTGRAQPVGLCRLYMSSVAREPSPSFPLSLFLSFSALGIFVSLSL